MMPPLSYSAPEGIAIFGSGQKSKPGFHMGEKTRRPTMSYLTDTNTVPQA
jgi:hypothetical protein